MKVEIPFRKHRGAIAASVALLLGLVVSGGTAVGASGDPQYCYDKLATIVSDSPVIVGTPGNDVIVGGDGDQHIVGLGGSDTIHAGYDDDQILGTQGTDKVQGSDGVDFLLLTPDDMGDDDLDKGSGGDPDPQVPGHQVGCNSDGVACPPVPRW